MSPPYLHYLYNYVTENKLLKCVNIPFIAVLILVLIKLNTAKTITAPVIIQNNVFVLSLMLTPPCFLDFISAILVM